LLSIGYSACHWCHVMARESFADAEIAAQMNADFVCLKVDREERPDLDAIYMQAVQAMTGSGGWPMTVFLTPDGAPFYGGTYFPPEDGRGLPGFPRVLRTVADAYRHRRGEVARSQAAVLNHLQQELGAAPSSSTLLSPELLDQAAEGLLKRVDEANGGFGGAPKFPQAMTLDFLLRYYARRGDLRARRTLERTLDKMARGGIYDQVGGGFHRYAVDARWLTPHFEKMLYDNALLSQLYLHAYKALGAPLYRQIAEQTLDYVQRELTSPDGGFYSSEDADSEGEEGKFYIWTKAEIIAALGQQEGEIIAHYYGVNDGANFEGRNILHVPRDADVVAHLLGITPERLQEIVQSGRGKLLAARAERVRPGRDDKILAAWNGWMLSGFAQAARRLERDDYRQTALRNAEFLWARLQHDGGRLWRTHKDGQSKLNGYLEDYAAIASGLLDVWELTFEARWFLAARQIADQMIAHFADEQGAGFYDTSDDHEALIVRAKNLQDNATPSGNALAASVLLRLAAYTGEVSYERLALGSLRAVAQLAAKYPQAFGQWLGALDFHLAPPIEIAIIGDPQAPDAQALLAVVLAGYRPNQVIAVGLPESAQAQAVPLLAGRPQREGKATAYICQRFTCQSPVSDPAELRRALG
jgi:hypothetical protein